MLKYLFSLLLSCFTLSLWAQNEVQLGKIQKNAHTVLYKGCQNEIHFFFPEKWAGKEWTYTIDYGKIEVLEHRHDYDFVLISPDLIGDCTIRMKSGEIEQTYTMRVNPVPPPVFYLASEFTDAELSLKNPVSPNEVKQIVVKADATFQQFLPHEAKYQVWKSSATVFRGGRSIGHTRFSDGKIDFSKIEFTNKKGAKSLQAGDGVQLTVEEVVRIDAQGRPQRVNIPQPYAGFFIK